MFDDISTMGRKFAARASLDGRVDEVFDAMRALGFEALIYDYTPRMLEASGEATIPSLLKLRNVSPDMREYWCDRRYFRIDPVQRLAMRTAAPFYWSYEADADTRIRRYLTEDTQPVTDYLRAHDMTTGVTVPIHMPRGDYATVTGLRYGCRGGFEREALGALADFSLMAQVFHETAYELFDAAVLDRPDVRLTNRERECLRHSSQGLSAKEISRILDRSVPTVVMHLNAAAKKLGARNRTQAVVIATRQGLLDEIGAP